MLTDPAIIRDWVKMYKKYGEEGIEDTFLEQLMNISNITTT